MATINPWKQFSVLLPKPGRVIGTVVSHNSNGTSTLTLRSGTSIIVRGQAVPVNNKALIEGREIIRQIPDLPIVGREI